MTAEVSATREHDVELAQRAATGDRTAQRALFLAQRDHVHRALYRILGSNRELEDLVQDAFIEIFRSLPAFRGDSSLARWCQTIAVRVAYLWISRRKPPTVELSLVEDVVANEAGAADVRRVAQAREAARRLYAALDKVEAHQRIAFTLFTMYGMALSEVAAVTGTTVFATKMRVWRARRTLTSRAKRDPVLAQYLEALPGGER